MTEQDQNIFNQLPKPSRKLAFRLLKVEDVYSPHLYCITPKHLEYADSMYLDEVAIARAEAKGAKCDICIRLHKVGKQPETLPFNEHLKQKALFVEVENNQDLNEIKGLHSYLLKVKPLAERLGIQGFAFPAKKRAE